MKHGRDFELSGKTAQLNVTKTLFDMCLSPVRGMAALLSSRPLFGVAPMWWLMWFRPVA